MRNLLWLVTSLFSLCFSTFTFAEESHSVEFFASNSKTAIDLPTAYKRLQGNEQHTLRQSMQNVMLKNHVDGGKFEDVIGTYQFATDGNTIADNSDAYITSKHQAIPEKDVFNIAKQLAESMQMENVTVFIPSDKPSIGKLVIRFTSEQPTIAEAVKMIHRRLPITYSQAYSLRLKNNKAAYNNAKVSEIVWLGSMIDIKEVKTAFPNEKISSENGIAYSVYQDGQTEQL